MRLPDPEARPLLTVEETAEILGIGRSSAYEAVARGEIPSLRLGRRLRVPCAGLRRLVQLDAPERDEGRPYVAALASTSTPAPDEEHDNGHPKGTASA